jgi:phage portal protein BeeE
MSFENPSISLSDASLVQLFDGTSTTAGPNVSEQSAIGSTLAVYRCVSLLAGMVGGLPMKVYRYKDKSSVIVRVLDDPGEDRTPYEMWETVMTHLLLWGNAYVLKRRNPLGAISGLVPIAPSRVAVKVVDDPTTGPVKRFEVSQRSGPPIPLTAPDEAQFLQTRHWQMVEIARLYGIPPHLLGDPEARGTGTSIEANNIGLVSYTLQPWLSRIEQRVTREIVEPSTQYAEFLTEGLLRGVLAERYAAYASGIQWGHLTRNEARRLENREPLPGLDEPLTPLNMVSGNGDENGVMAPQGPPPAPDTPTKSIDPKPLKGVA